MYARAWIRLIPLLPAAALAEDLSLAEAVRRAVTAHPTAAAAQAAVRAASARAAETRAGRLPRVDYQESWTRSNHPVFAFGSLLSQGQFAESNFAVASLNHPGFLNNFQSLVSAEYSLWDGGRTARSSDLADLQRRTAVAGVRQVELGLASRTARAYLDALLAGAAAVVAEQAVQSAESGRNQAAALRDAGRTTDADALAAEVHVAERIEDRIARRAEYRMALAALRELTGMPEGAEINLTTPIGVPAAAPPPAAPARPELEAGRLNVLAANRQMELARASRMPQVGARVAFEADRQRFVTRAGSNWTAGLALRWTPFDGGAGRAREQAAREMSRQAEAAEQAVARQVRLEVEQAEMLLEATGAKVAAAESAIAAAEESLRITRDRYGAGLATITDLLRAETALTQAMLRRLAARREVRLAQLNREAALGRLSPDSEVLR